jgi:hypothetical protein
MLASNMLYDVELIFYALLGDNMKMLSLLILALMTSVISANEIELTTISNDENNTIYHFVAVENETTGEIQTFFKDNYINGKKVSRTALNYKDLSKSSGIILEQRDKYIVLSLKSDNFDLVRGGTIIIDTLYNGASNDRKTYELELAKDKIDWKLFLGNQKISKLRIEVNKKLVLGVVGVKNIRME